MEYNEKTSRTMDAYHVIDYWPQSASWKYSRGTTWQNNPSNRFIYNGCIFVSNGTKPGNVAHRPEH